MTPTEVVRAYFEAPDPAWLTGRLGEWAGFHARITAPRRHESEYTFHEAEVLEETETRAVVLVRADAVSRLPQGTFTWHTSFDGPVVLEQTADGWRIADYTVDGRRRSENLVIGPLAEQENGGVTVCVLGADRLPGGTEILVEVGNHGTAQIRVERGLVLQAGVWRRPVLRAAPIGAGESAVVALTVGPVALTQQSTTLGLRVRSGGRKLPFLLHVPLAVPAEPFRSQPPRRLPLLHGSPAALLAVYGVATVALALFLGWLALALPILALLVSWRNRRVSGRLPARLQPLRRVLDVVVVGLACGVPWLTPAAELSVPVAVGVLAFLLLRLARLDAGKRMIVAASVATGWLALLGGPTQPLSPCRLADGKPSRVADAFARDVYRGDFAAASRLSTVRVPRFHPRIPGAATPRRRGFSNEKVCSAFGPSNVSRCYLFVPKSKISDLLMVGVGCDARRWRVRAAF